MTTKYDQITDKTDPFASEGFFRCRIGFERITDGKKRIAGQKKCPILMIPHPGGVVSTSNEMAQKFIDAHSSHEQGMNWIGYSNRVGGAGPEFHYFIAMDKLGDMDSWPPGPSVMIDSLGAEEWQKMQKT